MINKIKFLDCETKPHPSWDDFFTDDRIPCLQHIEGNLRSTLYTPKKENIFRFTQMDLSNCKVVILGQDPYPQEGVATGLAFEVGDIDDWNVLKNNASLRNILKLIHKNQKKINYVESIKNIRTDLKNGVFKILPPDKLFTDLEKQGVLCLTRL